MQQEFSGHGTYQHLYWNLVLAGDSITDIYELMSLHELFHSDLDVSTDFGSLLCAYAHLRDAFHEASPYAEVHKRLVRNSTRTHETGATFLSLLLIADPGYVNWPKYPLGDYETYLRLGLDFCKELSGRFFRFHAVLAALRVCMQAPVTALALKHGLEAFRLRDLASTMMPDSRYHMIRQITSIPGFWRSAIDGVRQNSILHPDWNAALQTEITDTVFSGLFGSERDGLSTILLKGFHEALANRLEALGIPTLAYDGHMATTSAVVEACNVLTQSQPRVSFQLSIGTRLHPTLGTIQNLERERIVIREQPLTARILPISVDEYIEQIQDSLKDPRVTHYVAVRTPERLLQQYNFDPTYEHLLHDGNDEPWCFVQSSLDYESQKHIIIVRLRQPSDLTVLARSSRCFSSVSNAVLNRSGWENWRDALADRTFMTVLLDTSPFRQIERWAERHAPEIRFGQINATGQNGRYSVFWLEPDGKTLFLAPCSYVMVVTLKTFLERLSVRHNLRLEAPQLQGEPLLRLKPILYHLFEEASFDFAMSHEKEVTL